MESHADGDEFWGEIWTKDQIDIISCMYKVDWFTENISWIPKPTAWKGSGLDVAVGVPTMNLGINIGLLNVYGEFKCENQTEWRKSLKLCQDAPKVSEALETLSTAFLEKHANFFFEVLCLQWSSLAGSSDVLNESVTSKNFRVSNHHRLKRRMGASSGMGHLFFSRTNQCLEMENPISPRPYLSAILTRLDDQHNFVYLHIAECTIITVSRLEWQRKPSIVEAQVSDHRSQDSKGGYFRDAS
ncbi:uncharacterized protein ARMOST_20308 [Armillaria ostoyae]|uniref:Uncharacterized protein n=1 Tax=Armillaria ostoyae TaxID=47428 RepID=A0A284S702_ARMOS|nr:uncharacterized protein ARMOST_20308 [Armillaria ostoyae]